MNKNTGEMIASGLLSIAIVGVACEVMVFPPRVEASWRGRLSVSQQFSEDIKWAVSFQLESLSAYGSARVGRFGGSEGFTLLSDSSPTSGSPAEYYQKP